MTLHFRENSNIQFEISEMKLNFPIHIKHNNLFLRRQENFNNIVDFTHNDDKTGRQHWIIESDETDPEIYYIKNAFNSIYSEQYLGCPNRDSKAYLYTTRNRYTKWQIINVESNLYILKYAGEKFKKEQHTIVVARYNECLKWLLPYNDCTTVYNKGKTEVPDFNTVIKIPNKGREGDTYLYHMEVNYNNLSDRITFMQGESLPHNNTILFALDNFEKLKDTQPLGLRWLEYKQIPPSNVLNKYKTTTNFGLEYLVIQINNNLDYANQYYFYDIGIITVKNRYFKDYKCQSDIINHFLQRCDIVAEKQTDEINYTWSALFSLKKQMVHKYKIQDFKNIRKQLILSDDQAGAEGYVLEKLWLYLFE